MNALKDLIQRCHQRRKKSPRQRKTILTPALDKARNFHFTVHCARQYPVQLYELEQADISFMPIGRAPKFDHGPRDFGGERFLRQQCLRDWSMESWQRSWGIQIYTGTPSAREGAHWHDIHFKYAAVCAAPDAVLTCIEALISTSMNPLLTLTNSGGIRFSCRIPNYLHPNTVEAKQYIYQHTPTSENPHHRDVYLEIFGDKGYSRWDARYEILLGNLLNPPIIAKEIIFGCVDALRTILHQPAPPSENGLEQTPQSADVTPPSLGSHNLDLAMQAFIKRGFTYVQQKDGFHCWTLSGDKTDNESVSLWETEDGVWVRASTFNVKVPMEAALITDVWDDTGILPPIPATGLSLTDKMLAVREGKLSPLAIKRPNPVLRKPERENKVYETLEQNAVHIQRIFNQEARIIGLTAEAQSTISHAIASYVRNGGAISLNVSTSFAKAVEQRFEDRNLPSVVHWKPRNYLWEEVKKIPVEARMTTPFQRGNVCEDPERCDALEERGGNPNESICPQCPVYTECQERGYLSQLAKLQRAKVQMFDVPRLLWDPQYAELAEKILTPIDSTDRLWIIDKGHPAMLFTECLISKKTLKAWRVAWRGFALGNFIEVLLDALVIKDKFDDNAIGRIRFAMLAFERYEEMIVQQMCQVNIPGKVVPRSVVDPQTGETLAHFSVEFQGGVSAYIPIDNNATNRLMAQQLPHVQLRDFLPNADVKVPMSMTKAIALGILDTTTVENIRAFPAVNPNPNWTLWHQLKRFFAHYTRDADAPMLWTGPWILHFWVPTVLHPSVKRLLCMLPTLSDHNLRRAFPDEEEIAVPYIKPTAWVPGNKVFQIRTGIYQRQTLLNEDTDWYILGMSKIGQRFLLGIQAEIEKDSSIKHAIIAEALVMKHLESIVTNENVCFAVDFKNVNESKAALETADVIWIVGAPYWQSGYHWRQSQILFGDDEKSLCYDGEPTQETVSSCYKDERVQNIYEFAVAGLLNRIVGKVGLDHLPNKTVVLLTSTPLPNITDRPETLLFDWEDFEVAGGLDKLPEVIAERERFEVERANLTAESGRRKVQEVLGISKTHANRLLMQMRGGKIERVPFDEQIHSLLESGEKTTAELIAAINGHPGAVKNELKRLVDAGEIVKVRRAVYALHSEDT